MTFEINFYFFNVLEIFNVYLIAESYFQLILKVKTLIKLTKKNQYYFHQHFYKAAFCFLIKFLIKTSSDIYVNRK